MSNQPFMQLYVGDYLADTTHLTTEQHGAYLLLLMTMWRHDAKLPNDPAKLARIARTTTRKWGAIWDEIGVFFKVEGDHITNPRLTKEHQKAQAKSELRADAGARGGKAKALKEKEVRLAKAIDLPCHSSEVRDQIEKEEPNGSSKKPASRQRKSRLPEDWALPREWGEWAMEKGLDEVAVRREAPLFKDHHISHGNLMLDWRRAWQKWVGNAIKWKAEQQSQRQNRSQSEVQRIQQLWMV